MPPPPPVLYQQTMLQPPHLQAPPPGMSPELYQRLLSLTPVQRAYIRQQEALAKKAKARNSLNDFARYVGGFEPARHHKLLNEKLEAVARGEIKRLMIFMPPGHAKSTYASHMFPAWYLGNYPTRNIICASNTDTNATRFGRRVRNTMKGPDWCFDAKLAEDSSAMGEFATDKGGEYFAVGVGGTVTSRRADLILIDDPIKGAKDADSPLARENAKEWYVSDLYTRRSTDDTAIVLIQTRWNEDDLAGWLLEEAKSGGEEWEVLRLPFEAEADDPMGRAPGEYLWPERYGAKTAQQAKRNTRTWFALFQQRPTAEEGDYFKREWLQPYASLPDNLAYYGASDYATKDGDGDYTVHLVVGVDPLDNIYVVDLWREQTTSDKWIETWLDMVEAWEPVNWAEEGGQIKNSLAPFMAKRMTERQLYCERTQYTSSVNKRQRARSIQARMAGLKLFLPAWAPWKPDFEDELLKFDKGANDDQVDALGLIGRMLFGMHGENVEQPVTAPRVRGVEEASLDELWDEAEGGNIGRNIV